MKTTRRQALLTGLYGTGYIGLRALATGLPVSFLLNPRRADAFPGEGVCADKDRAQYIVLSTSGSGDPMNGNVPGMYDDPNLYHSADPQMAATTMALGGQTYLAAKPWATLPQDVLDQSCFFHHTTLTNNHGNESKVMKLMGAVKRSEMFGSLFAKQLAPCLDTVQKEPVVVSNNYFSAEGRVLPVLNPTSLRDILVDPPGPLTRFRQIRDTDLDRMNTLLKQTGTKAQRDVLDRYALSQQEARSISQQLIDNLTSINSNNQDGQINAALALIKMNVTPVAVISIGFGGDNHGDRDLRGETTAHVNAANSITRMMRQLDSFGLRDKVTFVAMNVFGRTLLPNASRGRDHLANHHCTVMIGKGFKGSVIGGVEPRGNNYAAQPIDSRTGRGDRNGDIVFEDTLGAVGKTLGVGLGIAPSVVNDQITQGKIVPAALADV